MQQTMESSLAQIKGNKAMRTHLRQSMTVLSLLVVLAVFWGLKLTGITMAGEAFCGMEEHRHGEECPIRNLVCELEETEAHTHGEACILREQICMEAEVPAHFHGDECLSKIQVCPLQEQEGHAHSDACHIHTLTCLETERDAHFHEDGCYTVDLICGMDETEGHVHGETCGVDAGECGLEESAGHFHGEECYQKNLTCGMAEDAGHAHGADCYIVEPGISCGQEELPAHCHGDECFEIEENVFLCNQEETEGHSHGDACYRVGIGFGCGLLEADGHVHTAECVTPETELSCGKVAGEGHAHGDECYDILEYCPLEEHVHDESCYSDHTADVETSDDWEMSLAGMIRSTSTAKNIVMVAESQLGNAESIRNFQVDPNGIRRGITRYGQWYGNAYGDWSAMFASFCLYYAGVEDVPVNAGVETLRLEWEEAELYCPAYEAVPVVGHLLFLDKNENGAADSVAIICDMDEYEIKTIEGDVEQFAMAPSDGEEETQPVHVVAQTAYRYDDPAIMGYGLVPFEEELMMLPSGTMTNVAKTTEYNASALTASGNKFLLYVASGSNYYAIDGSGNAVLISIDENGNISADVEKPDTLLWKFTKKDSKYQIQNVNTQKYLLLDKNNVIGNAQNITVSASGQGAKLKGGRYLRFGDTFQVTDKEADAAVIQFGITSTYTVWLDGTNGGIMAYNGSPDEKETVISGTYVLPTAWDSPAKYSYTLQGWYDIVNAKYYQPGASVEVTEDLVFYADWKASTYDIGQSNDYVVNTVSTNDFVTTHMFDYGFLFNVLSEKVDVTFNTNSHSEIWSLLTSGTNNYNGQNTLGYIFRDWDKGSEDISYPKNHNAVNNPTNGGAYTGLYTETIGDLLFNPRIDTIGKLYLGTADHLFQFEDDPTDDDYGFYYYDSKKNAASYNQSDGRFYVYNYLESTRTSTTYEDDNQYTDFLPLNSPYANTNGKVMNTYSYNGWENEYGGTTHYLYDCRYDDRDGKNIPEHAGTNFLFGMNMQIQFYLPVASGTVTPEGEFGNVDLYGNEMKFYFSGDDDVWVFVDGELVLDIGGLHAVAEGEINFSTGKVTVDGVTTDLKKAIPAGDRTLTLYYMERGSSMSNCAIYFNLAPRYSFTIQKEDVLTKNLLNGAEFSVYTDSNFSVPAELWTSEEAYNNKETAKNTFAVVDGKASMWGLSAGNTYYIKETTPPTVHQGDAKYEPAEGVLTVSVNNQGFVSTNADENGDLSVGYTAYDFRIDQENRHAYLIVTNAEDWVQHETSIRVQKKWDDRNNHANDAVTMYLTIQDQDGTVRRLREVQLNAGNNWRYQWDNLPKYWENGKPIEYGVEEAYLAGYYATVEKDESVTDALAFIVTNTPLNKDNETSLTVNKDWVYGNSGLTPGHEDYQVTVSLWADGKDTNRTVTLNQENDWTATFQGLPYKENDKVIVYSVKEEWVNAQWKPGYGEIQSSTGNPPTYTTTITNTYSWAGGAQLPSTGSVLPLLYTICGGSMMLASLVCGAMRWRKSRKAAK